MNLVIAVVLLMLLALLTLVSYVDRLYSEIGKFLSREFQDNIDAFEQAWNQNSVSAELVPLYPWQF